MSLPASFPNNEEYPSELHLMIGAGEPASAAAPCHGSHQFRCAGVGLLLGALMLGVASQFVGDVNPSSPKEIVSAFEIDDTQAILVIAGAIGGTPTQDKHGDRYHASQDLSGSARDAAKVLKAFAGIQGANMNFARADKKMSKNTAILKLEDNFKQPVRSDHLGYREYKVVFYSGHGGKSGEWTFDDPALKNVDGVSNGVHYNYEDGWHGTEDLSYEEVKALWEANKEKSCAKEDPSSCHPKLALIIDACHSGAWVDKAKQDAWSDVEIYASCQADESSADTPTGGIFMPRVVDLLQNKNPTAWSALFDGRDINPGGEDPVPMHPQKFQGTE